MKTLLTLVVPAALEEDLTDFLLAHPGLASGFTTLAAYGHGASAHAQSIAEEVSGRVAQTQFQIVAEQAAAQALLAALKAHARIPGLAWWLSPITDFGSIE